MAVKDKDSARPNSNGEREPADSWEEYFRFRPVAFFQRFLAQANKYNTSKEIRDYCTDAIRGFCVGVYRSAAWQIMCLAVIAGVMAYVVYLSGFVDSPEEVVALFTVVLSAEAAVQWWTSHKQFKQTDQTLALTQLGMQPWVTISNARMAVQICPGDDLWVAFEINNTGNSVAAVFFTRAVAQPVVAGTPAWEAENLALSDRDNGIQDFFSAIPGPGQIHFTRPMKGLTADTIHKLQQGDEVLYILLQIAYENIFRDLDTYVCMCQFSWGVEELTFIESRMIERAEKNKGKNRRRGLR